MERHDVFAMMAALNDADVDACLQGMIARDLVDDLRRARDRRWFEYRPTVRVMLQRHWGRLLDKTTLRGLFIDIDVGVWIDADFGCAYVGVDDSWQRLAEAARVQALLEIAALLRCGPYTTKVVTLDGRVSSLVVGTTGASDAQVLAAAPQYIKHIDEVLARDAYEPARV